MNKILVSGLINIETTLRVDCFPINYEPVRFPFHGIHSTVSGVGFNVAKALSTLGSRISLLSMVGQDLGGQLALKSLEAAGLPYRDVIDSLPHTPQSVIMFDTEGKHMINTDLKDIQEAAYPMDAFEVILRNSSMAVLSNINFSRPFLRKARQAGKPVATDVHAIADLDDDYNREFMEAADILFMSDERLPCSPEEWAQLVMDRFSAEVLVIGLGAQGALLSVRRDGSITSYPAVHTRRVINTIGAGDALFSAFIHFYHNHSDPYYALKIAMLFASYKIGEHGAADGFLDEAGLETLIRNR
jgi:acarbose 7IV-phosphotransferase